MVSLQRSIYTVTGNLVDPMEISCKFTKAKKNFPILAYVGLLIVLDEIHFKNDGYLE